MNDDLNKALAELRLVTPPNSPWEAGDIGVGSSPVDYHIATILNAALSGTLIPRADADLAELATLRAQVERLTGALTIAANRLHRCSVDYDTGTREFIEVGGWADEARAALTEGAALEAHERTLPTDQG